MLGRAPPKRYCPYEKGPPRPKKISRPLYFFYDCETTGPSPLLDEIIEMAAIVTSSDRTREFSRLVKTNQRSSFAALNVHGIKHEDVQDESPFPEVLEAFHRWVILTTKYFSRTDNVSYIPVLVAHNGCSFDYRVLLAEMERHEIDNRWLEVHNVCFADSLQCVRQSKKDGSALLGDTGLGLESLCMHFFPNEEYYGHRALQDAKNLQRIFTQSPLRHLLEQMPSKSFQEQLQNYQSASDRKEMLDEFDITPQQAQRLADLKLSVDTLRHIYKKATSNEEFDYCLHRIGVNSKTVREELLDSLGI